MKRVVTGVDSDGSSYVVSAEELPAADSVQSVDLWRYEPSDIAAWVAGVSDDVAATAIEPPIGGAWWVTATFPPGGEPISAAVEIPGMDENGFHTTRTIDFALLLSGELTLELDRESVRLDPGDVVVQQVTRHAWINESADRPAVLMVLMHTPARGTA